MDEVVNVNNGRQYVLGPALHVWFAWVMARPRLDTPGIDVKKEGWVGPGVW